MPPGGPIGFDDRGHARGPAFPEQRQRLLQEPRLPGGTLVSAAKAAREGCEQTLGALEVGEQKFRVDRFPVRGRIGLSVDMGDVRVIEATEDVCNRVDLPDMPQETVSQPLTLRGSLHKPSDIDEAEAREFGLR